MKDILFFKSVFKPDLSGSDHQPPGFHWELWTPSYCSFFPKGMKSFPYFFWLILHICHVFFNRGYRIFLIRDKDERIVHRSVVTPGYFRFPFMKSDDLQIGNIWTAEDQRGKGLSVFAMNTIMRNCYKKTRTIWYLVEQDNEASTRVAERAGFTLYGKGYRRKRFGLKVLGYYHPKLII
jgi:RimJ/RimL family protein N-acetyltransferase